MDKHISKLKILVPAIIGFLVLVGLYMRLTHISDNQFLFYDEGMYLGYNRIFLDLVANNPAHNLQELGIILSLMLKTALGTAKALWFFILNLRVFIFGTSQALYFARWISAASGLGTVVLLYFWSRRYLKSNRIAILSALILLLLPSHVFYSRLGMQESLSTLLFLGAIYLYMLHARLRWSFYLSAFILACVYLTNYRMIISPIFIAFIEVFRTFASGKKLSLKTIHWEKVVIYSVCFYAVVLVVGFLYGGENLNVNLAWMFHQAQDAGGKFSLINFLSYPYYTFVLEGFFFAVFFWGNLFFLKDKQYAKFLPFGLVLLQMGMFSFAAEKGARYICVVLPFMAAAAAVALDEAWRRYTGLRVWVLTFAALALAGMIYLSYALSQSRTDYGTAMQLIEEHDPKALIVSTQPLVESLFLPSEKQIVPCPTNAYSLAGLYKQGARYLVVDPQAYISWDLNGRRFSPPLDDFLQTALDHVQPLAVLPHLDNILLTRFVLDHNEQILDSTEFLANASSKEYGKIRIYDLGAVLSAIMKK